MLFHFSDYVLDASRRELRCGEQSIEVEPQVLDLLIYLMRNNDRVITKDDLIASVWGGRDRVGHDADEPHLRGAKGDRRQRPQSDADPHHRAQGPAFHRRRAHRGGRRSSAVGRATAERSIPACTTGAAVARPARHRGAAVQQHERRSRAGLFFRRDQRRHHHRAVQAALVLRHRAQLFLPLQGQVRST